MSQFITFVVLGFPSGAIYLGISVGLVTVYLSSGILNFAQAAIAMWGCYVFAALRTSGKLVFPVGTVTLGNSVGSALALIIALVMTVILGEIIHLLIFRPLRRASVMAQIVASVAVLITLVGLATVRFGADTIQVPSMLPNHTYNIGGAHIGLANLVIAAIAIVLACAVGAYFRWTTPGVATRAASSNQDALGLMGYSPTTLDSAAWAIASVVSALMVILGCPYHLPQRRGGLPGRARAGDTARRPDAIAARDRHRQYRARLGPVPDHPLQRQVLVADLESDRPAGSPAVPGGHHRAVYPR